MIEIRLPKPGPEIEDATITSWECAEGDKIGIGDILAIIKTPVGSFKVAAEEQGILESILQHQGDSINFEEPIAMLRPELSISNFKETDEEEETLPFPEDTDTREEEPEASDGSWEEEVIDLPEEPISEEITESEEPEEVEEQEIEEPVDAFEDTPAEFEEEPEPVLDEEIPEALHEEEPEAPSEAPETEIADTIAETPEPESAEEDTEEDQEPETIEDTIPFETLEDNEPEEEESWGEGSEEDTEPMEDEEELPQEEESTFPDSLEYEISPAAMKLADEAGIDLATVRGSGDNGKIHYVDVENAIWERAKINQAREQAETSFEPEEAPVVDETESVTEEAPVEPGVLAEEDISAEEEPVFTDPEDLQEIDEGIYGEQDFDSKDSVETTPGETEQEPAELETEPEATDQEIERTEENPLPAFDDISIQYNMEQKDDLIIPFNTTKKDYADLMSQSNASVPQIVLFAEIDFTNAGRWQEVYNTENKTGITVADMMVKTCGHALALMPEMNAYVRPDRLILKRSINIAVTTPVDEGVVAPVVPDVYHKPLHKVSEAIRKNTSLASQSKVVLDYDSAFTVSDLGMYGVKRFTPLVTPPQTACLAVGAVTKRVVPVKDFAGVREIVEVALACDHRAVDGAAAARFLQIIRNDLESMIPGEDPDWIKGNEQLRLI